MHRDVHCCPVYNKKWFNRLECVMDSYLELATLKVKNIAFQITKHVQDF